VLHSTSVKDKACDTSFFDYIDSLSRKYGCAGKSPVCNAPCWKTGKHPARLRAHLDQHKQLTDTRKLGLDAILELAVLEFPCALAKNSCASLTGYRPSDSLFAVLKEGLTAGFETTGEQQTFAYRLTRSCY
jgi:hypothetical protein